jgi:hypothetical protein
MSRSRVIVDKLIVIQLHKKYIIFYEIWKSITDHKNLLPVSIMSHMNPLHIIHSIF